MNGLPGTSCELNLTRTSRRPDSRGVNAGINFRLP